MVLPVIGQTVDNTEVQASKHRKVQYSQRYLEKLDNYNHLIEDTGFHNNSANMHNVLSQNYNEFHKGQRDREYDMASEVITPVRLRKKGEFDINFDVNDIIRKSIGNKVMNYPKANHMRIGNLQSHVVTPALKRLKMRNNSKT